MRWQKRSIPALPKTCIRKMPSKAALLKRTRAQRIPFRPGVRYSNKGRIHSRRPILSSSFFRLQNGGGPYIPDGPQSDRNATGWRVLLSAHLPSTFMRAYARARPAQWPNVSSGRSWRGNRRCQLNDCFLMQADAGDGQDGDVIVLTE